jgi:hypothetical protein
MDTPTRPPSQADRPLPPPPSALPAPPHGPWRSPEEERRRRSGRVVIAAMVAIALVAGTIGAVVVGAAPSRTRASTEGNDDYAFLRELAGGRPYRWDPCLPIHYEVNLQDAPDYALADVRGAIERISEASGFRFAFDGLTSRSVDDQIGRAFQTGSTPRWLPVLIAWVPHEHFNYLIDTSRAAAFGMPRTGDGAEFSTYESGVVAIDAGGDLSPGFTWRFGDGVVLMHELGHVLGLAHVGAGDEVMWSPQVAGADPRPDPGVTAFGPGDLHGLEILGRHGACPASN